MTAPRPIARITITLLDIEPPVSRRLEIPYKLRLHQLHSVIQAAMSWTDTHLYAFLADGVSWGIPDPMGGDDILRADRAWLPDVVEDVATFTLDYVYDFGDDWHHRIEIEAVEEAAPRTRYPRLLEANGNSPPEDIGGPPGYAEFLDALADPDHEDREEILAFEDEDFDPHTPNTQRINRELNKLAQRWAPRSSKSKTSKPRS